MLFNSLTFVIFFAIVLALHHLPIGWRWKKLNLLLGSYLFYAAWNPPFVLLLWLSTVVDYVAAGRIAKSERLAVRRAWLLVSMGTNLGMLGFFKYGGFLLDNFVAAAGAYGFDYHPAMASIILPVGISFYTFQTMSYTIDVYRRNSPPTNSFLDFALFVTFFPQLVAGPIVRPKQLIPQFKKEHQATHPQLMWGLGLMTLGMFQKIVMADTFLAPSADAVFGAAESVPFIDAWLGALAFGGQIFFDFAGYSTIAIGAALCLGFSLPENFRYPYAAIGFSDFWKRWHISLSSWLRDYLYIPLGGNRKGPARTYINLMLTMLLGGLWHGAAWTFVAWGALHGFYLWLEKGCARIFAGKEWTQKSTVRLLTGLATFALITLTWVFFRAPDFATASRILLSMFGLGADGAPVLTTTDMLLTSVVVVFLFAFSWILRDRMVEDVVGRMPWWLGACAWAGMLVLIILTQGGGGAFIYFQF
ncbi:MBOAT family protein [Puniceicoccales bacterium CK1056]|uniref:MBOAT family protein n=1 Tax=Oceanipulchritudo coccoides TaxID=2706888 RepID=A0A6B2M1N8_9BACT|nr:MBOAT family O-acyltransferase [Oceanipulchritudo coccoides]NDV62054.1 MBOAT family protein [Oceanipulchritudo coccoides]